MSPIGPVPVNTPLNLFLSFSYTRILCLIQGLNIEMWICFLENVPIDLVM